MAGDMRLVDSAPLTLVPAFEFNDFSYSVANGAVTIDEYVGAGGSLEIPAEIEGLPVRVIGAFSFSARSQLTSVVIPASVTIIETSAFRDCINLTRVTIPKSVTSIGGYTFYGCRSLLSVTIPDGVPSIGSGLFYGCSSLTSVAIPSSVTSIGDWAFYDCVSLADVAIPEGVTSLGTSAFSRCASLASVTIPPGLTSLASGVFFGCRSLATVTIPEGVTNIGGSAFFGCRSLAAVYFVGDPPASGSDTSLFTDTQAFIYHRPDTTGWTSTFAGRPTATFQPFRVAAGEIATAVIAAGVSRILKQGPGTLVMDVASTLANGTIVEAGEVIVRHPRALGSGSLAVGAEAKLTLDIGTDSVAVPGIMVAGTGTLDLGAASLSVSAGGYDLAEVRGLIISGRDKGTWAGPGITSGSVRGAAFRELGHRVLEDGSLTVGYSAVGDATMDGSVNIQDLIAVSSSQKYGAGAAGAGWWQGDFNYDGVVNIVDLINLSVSGLYGSGPYLPEDAAEAMNLELADAPASDAFAGLAASSAGDVLMKDDVPASPLEAQDSGSRSGAASAAGVREGRLRGVGQLAWAALANGSERELPRDGKSARGRMLGR